MFNIKRPEARFGVSNFVFCLIDHQTTIGNDFAEAIQRKRKIDVSGPPLWWESLSGRGNHDGGRDCASVFQSPYYINRPDVCLPCALRFFWVSSTPIPIFQNLGAGVVF